MVSHNNWSAIPGMWKQTWQLWKCTEQADLDCLEYQTAQSCLLSHRRSSFVDGWLLQPKVLHSIPSPSFTPFLSPFRSLLYPLLLPSQKTDLVSNKFVLWRGCRPRCFPSADRCWTALFSQWGCPSLPWTMAWHWVDSLSWWSPWIDCIRDYVQVQLQMCTDT